ncbi:MAG: hypothetical protein J7K73_00680 [Nanoarchaeota archaeon]|nr:hypothetical protein [Nanoarchaeota archaeon]
MMLEKGIEEMMRIYQRFMLSKNSYFDIEGDELLRRYQQIQLKIAENEILQEIKSRYDLEYMLKNAVKESMKNASERKNNNPMYG